MLLPPLLSEERGALHIAVLAGQLAAIGLSFFGVYLYVVEVTAAECRASAAGLAMMSGRVAAAVCPFVREWLGNRGFLIAMGVLQALAVGIVFALKIEPNLRQLGNITTEAPSNCQNNPDLTAVTAARIK